MQQTINNQYYVTEECSTHIYNTISKV